jgi:hypothetical protein
MRYASYLFIFLLSVAPVQAQPDAKLNTLTPEEIAQGKVLIFDGKTKAGWIIEGDAEVKDGVLILGGSQKTRARIATELSPYFELHLEYSTANNQHIQLGIQHRHFLGHGGGSSSLDRTSKKQGEWIEAIYWGKDAPGGNGWERTSKWRVLGDPAFTEQPLGGSSSLPDGVSFSFEIPAGQKLYLRNVRLKTEPVDSFPWLLVLAVGAVVLVLIVTVLVVVIKKRRKTPTPA